jgi:type VI secretion system protein ImpC
VVAPVDVDNLEDLIRRLTPRCEIRLPGVDAPVDVAFRSLEDFRPDSLYERLPVFAPLRGIRERLLDSATFVAARADLEALLGSRLPDGESEMGPERFSGHVPDESDAQTIERLLGRPASGVSEARSRRSEAAQTAVSGLIRQALRPGSVTEEPASLDGCLRAVDAAISDAMRALLHSPTLQSLEASWRTLHYLVTNLETDEGLQIHLVDVSKQELVADFAAAGGDLAASVLYRLLVDVTGPGTPGGDPWSLLVGNFEFGPRGEDIGLLAALGLVAASAGGPFLAAASSELLGCRSLAETPDPSDWSALPADAEAAWIALRQTPIAPWIGLALPRALLRLPYGRDTEPVDAFAFEEIGPERRHEAYLWGNPAFACALLIGHAYRERGWSMAPGDVLDVGDLPAHVYEQEGEKRLQACAEVPLTERAATVILDRGIMPFLSFKGRNLVRLARFQSIASPPAALMGSWRG